MSDQPQLQFGSTADIIRLLITRLRGQGFLPAPWVGPLFGLDQSGQVAVFTTQHVSIEIQETEFPTTEQGWERRQQRGAATVRSTVIVRWLRPMQLDGGHKSYAAAIAHEHRVVSALVKPEPPSVARVRVVRVSRSVLETAHILVSLTLTVDHPYRIIDAT